MPGALISFEKTDEMNSTIKDSLKSFELYLSNKFDGLSDQVQLTTKNSQLEIIECQIKESSKQHQVTFSDLTAKVVTLAKDITSNST